MIAIIDCNSFYCSCEEVFRPDLKEKAIVVLSNNDGTDNYFRSEFHINGTTYAVSQGYTYLDNDFGSSFSTVASLSANDYVQVVAVTAPVYGSGNTNYTHFSGFLIG